jgi:LysM repeat protein
MRTEMSRLVLPVAVALALTLPTSAEAQSLRGSRASVDLMYRTAQQQDLYFYQTTSGVRRAADRGSFVRLGGNASYQLAGVSNPYVLPATRTFVERLASQYRSACGQRLVVTSAARPKSQRLVNSVDKSVHPTGMAVDLRRPTTSRCLSWLRSTLMSLETRGVLEATEERNPPHFHVAVFPRQYQGYVGSGGESTRVTQASGSASGSGDSERYVVRKGDSIWAISRRMRVSVEQIQLANNLTSSRIQAGQVIVIPR